MDRCLTTFIVGVCSPLTTTFSITSNMSSPSTLPAPFFIRIPTNASMAKHTFFCHQTDCSNMTTELGSTCDSCRQDWCLCPDCGDMGATVLGSNYCHECYSRRNHPCNAPPAADGWCPECNMYTVVLPNICDRCQQAALLIKFPKNRRCIECDDILNGHEEEDKILCDECDAEGRGDAHQNPFMKMFCDGCETDCPVSDNFMRTGICDSCCKFCYGPCLG